MEHSIALITGTTSWLGYAAARSLAGVQETAAQLAAQEP
jgi:NAD(P)-dependent dehydrogenase (short-subunit alcohol dehydrogenase family)